MPGKTEKRDAPCLYYHIGRCSAPCCGKISSDDYRSYVRKAENLLKGKTKGLKRELAREMGNASRSLDYERAALMRDFIESIEMIEQQADPVEFSEESRDYIACWIEDNLCTFSIFQIRSGRISGRNLFRTRVYSDEEDAFTEFFLHYYTGSTSLPEKIYISGRFNPDSLVSYLNRLSGTSVSIFLRIQAGI